MTQRWIPDPAVLETVNRRGDLTWSTFNALFGVPGDNSQGLYSIQQMFNPPSSPNPGIGLGPENMEDELYLPADLEIPAGEISQSDVGGIMSGIIDVTAYGAVGDGVTNDYTSIRNAVLAAKNSSGTSRSTVVWFPRGTYICNPGSATLPSVEIFPGLTYWGAPGSVVKRTDAASSSNETPVFGTLSTWNGDSSAAAFIRGFVIDGDGKGHTGVYITSGKFALVEQCIIQYCKNDNSSYSNRAGVSIDSTEFGIVEDCIIQDCTIACYFNESGGAVQRNWMGYTDGQGVFSNVGQRGIMRIVGSGPYGMLVAWNSFTGANKVGSSTARNAAILSEVDGAVILGNVISTFRRGATSGIALGDAGGVNAGSYNIVRSNKVFDDSKSQTPLAIGVGIAAERNERNAIVGNSVYGLSEGQAKFQYGIKTTPASGISTYGKNVVGANQVGKNVTTPYALNDPDLATHYDIDRADPPPVNVAWCRLSDAMDPEKRGKITWRPLGEGLFDADDKDGIQVQMLAKFDKQIVAGGKFDVTGARDAAGLARFSVDRWQELAQINVTATNRVAFGKQINGKFYFAGTFTQVNGATLKYVARMDSIDAAPTDLAGGVTAGPNVFTLEAGDSYIFVGGGFTQVTQSDGTTNVTATRFALYDADADQWGTALSAGSFNEAVYCAKRIGDQIWVGGAFTSVTSQSGVTAGAYRIARVQADFAGGPYNVFLSGTSTSTIGLNDVVWAIEEAGGYVMLGGAFTADNTGTPIVYLTLLSSTATTVSLKPFDWIPPSYVYAIQGVPAGDETLLGGKLYFLGGRGHIGIASIPADLNVSGSYISLPTTGLQKFIDVRAVLVDQENDLLFIGGSFYPNLNGLFPDANQTIQ